MPTRWSSPSRAPFEHERRIVAAAIDEVVGAGWTGGVSIRIVRRPHAHTCSARRPPCSRSSRAANRSHGLPRRTGEGSTPTTSRHGAARRRCTSPGPGGTDESPALVDNVETLANVPSILAEGVEWFRSLGTSESPGTLLATITGRTRRHGVGEVPMGTPLGEIIDVVGGGARPGRTLVAAISGVANAIVPASLFDTPATYEDMRRIGSGLGAGGFIVFDDESDLVAVAHAAARFLAVESCGQCEPCKLDGLAISGHLDAIRSSAATGRNLAAIRQKLQTVTRGARCYLAQQQEQVVASIVSMFPETFAEHIAAQRPSATCGLLTPIVDIVAGRRCSTAATAASSRTGPTVGRTRVPSPPISTPTSPCTFALPGSPRTRWPPPTRLDCPTASMTTRSPKS